ncbi:MAG: thioredoxin domain-containing protein, partial [Microbacterium sp.]
AGERYRAAAEAVVREHSARALAQPFAYGALLQVAAGLAEPPRQVVVVSATRYGALAGAARAADADVVAVVTPTQAAAFADAGFELFSGKAEAAGRAFDCRAFVCRLPVTDPAEISVLR